MSMFTPPPCQPPVVSKFASATGGVPQLAIDAMSPSLVFLSPVHHHASFIMVLHMFVIRSSTAFMSAQIVGQTGGVPQLRRLLSVSESGGVPQLRASSGVPRRRIVTLAACPSSHGLRLGH